MLGQKRPGRGQVDVAGVTGAWKQGSSAVNQAWTPGPTYDGSGGDGSRRGGNERPWERTALFVLIGIVLLAAVGAGAYLLGTSTGSSEVGAVNDEDAAENTPEQVQASPVSFVFSEEPPAPPVFEPRGDEGSAAFFPLADQIDRFTAATGVDPTPADRKSVV